MELNNKRILVTGAEGFIGSHLVEELVSRNYKVRAFVLYNSFNSWGWLDTFDKKILNKIEIYTGDIRDYESVRGAFKDIDIAFHLAALISIPYSYQAAKSYVETNINGTLNILQAAKEFEIQKLLVTSTSEVYGTALYVPIDEKHPRQGQSPYSATKIAADSLSDSFYRSFNLPVTIVRPFNTYGPRQSGRAVIPTIITQLLSGKKELHLGSLHPTRDLVYVKDTASAFLEIAKSDKLIGQEINIATNHEISIGELVNKIISLLHSDASIIQEGERVRPKNSEVERLLGDNKKITNATAWKPFYTLEQGLQLTIDWFQNPENLKMYKSHLYNV